MADPRPLEAFREEARAWLMANADPAPARDTQWGVGSDSVAVFRDETDAEAAASVAAACAWHRRKLDHGWAALTWPVELGGRALPARYERAFDDEESQFAVPPVPEAVTITLKLVAPTIAVHGTPEQLRQLIPALLRTDALSCQLFSEPEAGSDLASLTCRARRQGDGWCIQGQKVWTSGARQCSFGLLIARSDPTAPKHRGMTAFLVPLDCEGVEIRAIRQMTGGASFNEVFFDDVFVSDSLRIGADGDGWSVARTTLGFERGVSGDGAGGAGAPLDQVLALARHIGLPDPNARQELAQLYARTSILSITNERMRSALAADQEPGPVGSTSKLFWTQNLAAASDFASRVLGPRLVADTGEWGTYAWREHVLGAPGYRIAGGSDEIQRNIIGERVLGLPREPPEQPPIR